jgi:hypothetical protein
MSSRIKAALVVAQVFGAGTAVVAKGDEGKVVHGSRIMASSSDAQRRFDCSKAETPGRMSGF